MTCNECCQLVEWQHWAHAQTQVSFEEELSFDWFHLEPHVFLVSPDSNLSATLTAWATNCHQVDNCLHEEKGNYEDLNDHDWPWVRQEGQRSVSELSKLWVDGWALWEREEHFKQCLALHEVKLEERLPLKDHVGLSRVRDGNDCAQENELHRPYQAPDRLQRASFQYCKHKESSNNRI